MQFGAIFPQVEFGSDPIALRDYAHTVEGLGFKYILAYDHVLGANPERPDRLSGPYTHESSFIEPFTLFSFMAGVTQKLGFVTGILILPQRQTALVAKQAASLDHLCGGRLRVGIGNGWNHVEYQALNEDFTNRGKRIEEQVEVLRLLWTQPLVDYHGRWHTIPDAGIKPLPVQQPIPIWFGGHAEAVLRRAARLGDGWMPNYRLAVDAQPALDLLFRSLEENGRERKDFGIEARVPYGLGDPVTWKRLIKEWEAAGATHISLNTMGVGLDTPEEHLGALRNFAVTLGLG